MKFNKAQIYRNIPVIQSLSLSAVITLNLREDVHAHKHFPHPNAGCLVTRSKHFKGMIFCPLFFFFKVNTYNKQRTFH